MSIALIKKLGEFKNKFFVYPVVNTQEGEKKTIMWSFQHLPRESTKVMWWPVVRELREQDLLNHFSQKPMPLPTSTRGSLGCIGTFKDNKANWFCVDCDNQKAVDAMRNYFLPVLTTYGIEYIWEFSGTDDEEKAHLWIMCQRVDIDLLRLFTTQLFVEAGVNPRDKELNLELFPTLKPRNVIRLPGGIHLRTKKVNPIMWKGTVSSSAEFILDSFIDAQPLTTEFIKLHIKELPKERKAPAYKQYRRFFYNSRALKLPLDDLPFIMKKVASNCQAINKVIGDCASDKLMQDQQGTGHTAGLYLWNMALYNDAKSSRTSTKTDYGEQWIKKFTDEHRLTPYESHNWGREKAALFEEPERYFPSCKSWDNAFGYCDGCPFKDRPGFTNPKQLYYGQPIKKRLEKWVELTSAQESRTNTFKRVQNKIFQYLESNTPKDLLLASPQGSGKSVFIDIATIDLAARGFKTLIAVPTADLAMEHKKRIEFNLDGTPTGITPYVIMSHEKLFDKQNPGFDCPQQAEIKRLYDLGISSGVWKKSFCGKCPMKKDCPYPDQYAKLLEDKPSVVIIQHAHLSCRETMFTILQNKYDVMFVDEAFIDSCQKTIRPRLLELEILESFSHEFTWAKQIFDWLSKGGYPKTASDKSTIRASEAQLEIVKEKMDEHLIPWNVPDYIRYYNLNLHYDKVQGFQVFHPLPGEPYIKLRVFTDATPPIEYLKTILDNPDIEMFGEDEVLEYRKLNENNKIIQVLDSSMSKTSLKGEKDEFGEYDYQRFIEILEFIRDKALNEYKGQKILITTYADGINDQFKAVAETWFRNNLPDVEVGREPPATICISHMSIGTNKFEDYLIQFLVAGVYLNGLMFKNEVYKYRRIANYWNRLKDRPILPNPFPYGAGDNSSIEREDTSVKRILPISNRAAVFSFDDFTYRKPVDPDFDIIERFAVAKTQQAIRLRFNDSKKRIVYVWGNYFLPSLLVTDVMLEDDLLGYLKTKESVGLLY